MMVINNAPRMLRANSTAPRSTPPTAITLPAFHWPSVSSVASFDTITPPPFNPIKAMNKPIPTDMAYRKLWGIAFTMASLI